MTTYGPPVTLQPSPVTTTLRTPVNNPTDTSDTRTHTIPMPCPHLPPLSPLAIVRTAVSKYCSLSVDFIEKSTDSSVRFLQLRKSNLNRLSPRRELVYTVTQCARLCWKNSKRQKESAYGSQQLSADLATCSLDHSVRVLMLAKIAF